MSEIALEVRDVSRTFKRRGLFGSSVHVALNDLNFSLAAGEVLMLCGANGSGKSTFFRAAVGVITCSGKISVFGESKLRKRQSAVAWVPAEFRGDGMLTAHQNLAFFFRLYQLPVKASIRCTQELLEQLNFPLSRFKSQKVRDMSNGERQKLLLAAVLRLDRPLTFLDEPTSALDVTSQALVAKVLARECQQGQKTLVVATHDPHLAAQIGTRYMLLRKGAIKVYGGEADFIKVAGFSEKYSSEKSMRLREALRILCKGDHSDD